MTVPVVDLVNAKVLLPGIGLQKAALSLADGKIQAHVTGRQADLTGFMVLPGIIDLHGDAFERHVAPRRGAMPDMNEGVAAAEAEIATCGITTAVLAQFVSWEGGLRGMEFADKVFRAIAAMRQDLVTDLIPQLRFETHLLDDYATLPDMVDDWQVDYVVFNDHLPHDRLAAGKKPPRLTGQALKAGRNPDRHWDLLRALHRRSPDVPRALDELAPLLSAKGVRMGSHDDATERDRDNWRRRGVRIAEFPETAEAARNARDNGDAVILGAPNVVRGASHKGNASASDLVAQGLCDALASDYHYPSPRRAAQALVTRGVCDFATAWGMISSGPARVLGLSDRGDLSPGKRADVAILDERTFRVAGTLSGGRFSYLSGDLATRIVN